MHHENLHRVLQYIDTKAGTGEYNPTTLEEHWNGEHMRGVRRRMMAGEKLSECEVCTDKLLNTDVYRTYFWHLFQHKYDELWTSTDELVGRNEACKLGL